MLAFFINDKIDSGEILLQEKVEISSQDDAGTLHDKLVNVGSQLICTTIKAIFDNTLNPKPQQLRGVEKIAPKLDKENVFIDWNQSLNAINAKIRGLSPYPGAKTRFSDERKTIIVKIFEAEVIKQEHVFEPNLLVIQNRKILISHKEGFLNCKTLQLPDKKRMSALDIVNGHTFFSKTEIK